ncbi:hypothetical protein Hanom_Chr08g00751771 [Helianthus anomalus]
MVPVVSTFFTFSPHLLKIAGMLPMICHLVTRIVPEYMSVSLKITCMLPIVCHFVTRIVPRVNVGGLSEKQNDKP